MLVTKTVTFHGAHMDPIRARGRRALDIALLLGREFLAPEAGHIFEGLALGLGDQAPYEDGGDDADDTVEGIGEEVAEAFSHGTQLHVVHGHEGAGYDEVEDPLEGDAWAGERT